MKLDKLSYGFMRMVIKVCIYAVVIFVIYFVCTRAFSYGQKVFSEKGVEDPPGTPVDVTIPKGASASDIGDILESYGLIENGTIFRIQTLIYQAKKLKSGEYKLNTSYNAEQIINILISGPGSEEAVISGETTTAAENETTEENGEEDTTEAEVETEKDNQANEGQ